MLLRTLQSCCALLRSQIFHRDDVVATRKLQLQSDAKRLLNLKDDARANGWSFSKELILSKLGLKYHVPSPEPLPNIFGGEYRQIDENDRWANLILQKITFMLKKYRTDRLVSR